MFDSKFHQWMFAIAVGFIALACYWGKKASTPEALRVNQDFSYEMPRPKMHPGSNDLDLSGRSIIRKTETVKNSYVTAKGLPPAAVAAAARNAAKPNEATAKKAAEEQKKKIADAKKAEEARRAKAAVNIAKGAEGDSPMTRLADSSGASGASGGPAYGSAAPTASAVAANQTSAANGNDTPKLSPSQWQSLLMAQPTAANGAQFMAAYQARAVDSGTFYQIASALLTDSAKDRETLGLSLLRQTPSVKSFSILVDSSGQIQDPTLKTSATQAIAAYAGPSQFGVLAQALYSSDVHVVSTATDLITMALQTEGTQGTGSSGGSAATPQQFQIFIPGLRQLASSSDQTVASQAQALLSSIQALHV